MDYSIIAYFPYQQILYIQIYSGLCEETTLNLRNVYNSIDFIKYVVFWLILLQNELIGCYRDE